MKLAKGFSRPCTLPRCTALTAGSLQRPSVIKAAQIIQRCKVGYADGTRAVICRSNANRNGIPQQAGSTSLSASQAVLRLVRGVSQAGLQQLGPKPGVPHVLHSSVGAKGQASEKHEGLMGAAWWAELRSQVGTRLLCLVFSSLPHKQPPLAVRLRFDASEPSAADKVCVGPTKAVTMLYNRDTCC
jgi:hypothetical protein